MAREIGKAGKNLYGRVWRIAAVLGGVGLSIWLLIKLMVPWMGALALPLALLAVFRMLQDKDGERLGVASLRGYRGEAQIGRILSGLPCQVGRLPVMGEKELLGYLKALPPHLTFLEARRMAEILERRVR